MEKEHKRSAFTLEEIRRILYASTEEEALAFIAEMQDDERKGFENIRNQYLKWLRKERAEKERLAKMWERERALWAAGRQYIGGIDEAGRGPLAGPVVAACVIFSRELELPGLNDSKQLAPQERAALAEIIKKKALAWGIGVIDSAEIDRINILQATKKAMVSAVARLGQKPDYLLIDAVELSLDIDQEAIIHGDCLSASIAAASIVAKTYRDSLMEMLDVLYPAYGFKDHKGYGTSRHFEALSRYGPCPIHRNTFIQNREQSS